MISAVKKGDTIVTNGGIIGKVWRAEGGEVVVVIDKDKDVKARFTKAAIVDVIRQEDGEKSEASS
jgi:preprotein translocase YajC subunit